MSQPALHDEPLTIPVVPPASEWLAMSRHDRDAFILAAGEAMTRQHQLMGEGRQHGRARIHILSTLGDYTQRVRRDLYLASDLPVLYPGEAVFEPDLIAVRDVPDPGDADTRMAWDVAGEGLGIDLALEVLHSGDRNKDLVRNVAWFARLGIPEYFVYDRKRQRLYGYRLAGPEASRYRSIDPGPRGLWSEVLGLGLGVLDDRLRFFHEDGAVVPESLELLERANHLMMQVERRVAEEVEARQAAEARAEAEAEARKQEVEARKQEAEARKQEVEARKQEAEARQAAEARVAALEAELAALRARLG